MCKIFGLFHCLVCFPGQAKFNSVALVHQYLTFIKQRKEREKSLLSISGMGIESGVLATLLQKKEGKFLALNIKRCKVNYLLRRHLVDDFSLVFLLDNGTSWRLIMS